MSVIVIVSDSSPSDHEIAQSLADKLGYRCVQPEVVIERAAARGSSQTALRRALEKPPGVWRRFLHTPRIQLLLLRAALAEEIRTGNAICYGNLGWLLPGFDGLLRIRVDQDREARSALGRERLKLTAGEAAAWVRAQDRDARAWRRWARGPYYRGEPHADFSVNLESLTVEEACDLMAVIVAVRAGEVSGRKHLAGLEDLALSSRVMAALALDPATAPLELEVRAEDGRVFVRGKLRSAHQLSDVRRVVETVDGVTGLSPDEISLSADELLSSPALIPPRQGGSATAPGGMKPPWAWATMAAVMVFVISYAVALSRVGSSVLSLLFHPATEVLQTLTGVVTDTKCAASHASSTGPAATECVRRCVKTEPGVMFALHDGKTLYILANQADGDKFAGRRVEVTGKVDQAGGLLTAQSIRLL